MSEATAKWLSKVTGPLPIPLTHGEFNRIELAEFIINQSVIQPISLTRKALLENTSIHDREIDKILKEFVEEDFLIEEEPHFLLENEADGSVYKINLDTKWVEERKEQLKQGVSESVDKQSDS
jgi:hypothetical protein